MAWIDVLDESRLPEGAREVVEVSGAPVLLIRHGGEIFAVAARCPHMGAPLKNGRITEDGHLVCPWHRSAFSLRTGDVAAVDSLAAGGGTGPGRTAPGTRAPRLPGPGGERAHPGRGRLKSALLGLQRAQWSACADPFGDPAVKRVGEGRHLARSAQEGRFQSA
jgi:nitrite reductase/ring-hydroxylating ferredoxin subunit